MAKKLPTPKPPKDIYRYGIGEWFGEPFTLMTREQRSQLASRQALPRKQREPILCPFQSYGDAQVSCGKDSGVCTIREYRKDGSTGNVEISGGSAGALRTVCPRRFLQQGAIFQWVGQTILNHPAPLVVKEINFLQRPGDPLTDKKDTDVEDVGRIDHVLVHPSSPAFEWCALEIQAVYFSGDKMSSEFSAMREHLADGVPFPAGRRRPDDRSSGPKPLMPQLQTKVPSLRRWGKKMAVVIRSRSEYATTLNPVAKVSSRNNDPNAAAAGRALQELPVIL